MVYKNFGTFLFSACAALALAACSADPSLKSGETSGDTTSDGTVPETLANNLSAADYSPTAQTLEVTLSGIHGGALQASYQRVAALDTNGYEGYMLQRTPTDRHYTALFDQSNDGNLMAGVVADGGNNNRFFGGGIFERVGYSSYSAYEHPTSEGEAQYRGEYAAVTNLAGDGDQLLDSSGIDPNLTPPAQGDRIAGTILLNADFTNGMVDAEISNRTLVDDSSGVGALPDIMLIATDITSSGSFEGVVEYEGELNNSIGTYGGIFGGRGATSVAGVVHLDEFDGPSGSLENEEEYGVFVLTRCGADNDHVDCPDL